MKLIPENCLPFVRTAIYTSRNEISDELLLGIIEHYIDIIGNVRGKNRCDVIYASTLTALDWLVSNADDPTIAARMLTLYTDGRYCVSDCPLQSLEDFKHPIIQIINDKPSE